MNERNAAASVRARLLNRARETEPDFNLVLMDPKFLKLCGHVLYRRVDIEAFEESCLATSTKTLAAPVWVG